MRMRQTAALRTLLAAIAFIAASFVVAATRHVVWLEAATALSKARAALARSSSAVGGAHGGGRAFGPLAVGVPETRECDALLSSSSRIMFLLLGGRGYHNVRIRTILHTWARCMRHVLVFTDPSTNLSGYVSERRYVYISAGDAWRRRPYLPMTHLEVHAFVPRVAPCVASRVIPRISVASVCLRKLPHITPLRTTLCRPSAAYSRVRARRPRRSSGSS